MRINDIFDSISGEISDVPQGTRATFIRLAGCNLDCPYCDAPEAKNEENEIPNFGMYDVVDEIIKIGNPVIIFTGGEPLIQQNDIRQVLRLLADKNFDMYRIIVETNGTIVLRSDLYYKSIVRYVVDYKLPSSGCSTKNRIDYLELTKQDVIKFVISDKKDFEIFSHLYPVFKNTCEARLAVSPIIENISHKELFDLLKQENIHDVILNTQIHKFIDLK